MSTVQPRPCNALADRPGRGRQIQRGQRGRHRAAERSYDNTEELLIAAAVLASCRSQRRYVGRHRAECPSAWDTLRRAGAVGRDTGAARLATLAAATFVLVAALLLGLPAWQPAVFVLVGMGTLRHLAGQRKRAAVSA